MKYCVYFGSDTTEYHWRSFKTYWGARRYMEREMSSWLFRQAFHIDQWAIARVMPQAEWSQTCVLAQSLNWSHKTSFRGRSEADRYVKPVVQSVLQSETETVK